MTGRILRPIDIAKNVVHLLSDDSVMQSGEPLLYPRPPPLLGKRNHRGLNALFLLRARLDHRLP